MKFLFCKNLVSVLCYILEVLIVLKVVFELVMFVWGIATGTPPIAIFQQGVAYGSFLGVLLLVQELASSMFAYVVVAVLKSIACGCCTTMKHGK